MVRGSDRSQSRAAGLHRRDRRLGNDGPRYGCSERGVRCRAGVALRHRKTTSFVGVLRLESRTAPIVFDSAVHTPAFLAYAKTPLLSSPATLWPWTICSYATGPTYIPSRGLYPNSRRTPRAPPPQPSMMSQTYLHRPRHLHTRRMTQHRLCQWR